MGIWHKIRVTSKKECLSDIADAYEEFYPNPELPWWEEFCKWYSNLETTGNTLGAHVELHNGEAETGFAFFRTDDLAIKDDTYEEDEDEVLQ